MLETSIQPAPGWYPDPAGSGDLRFFDGVSWSKQTSPLSKSAPAFSTPIDKTGLIEAFPPAPSSSPEIKLPWLKMAWNFVKPSRSGADLLMRSLGTLCFMASVVLLSYSLWETRISAYFTAQAQNELRATFESKYVTPPVTGPLAAAPVNSPARQSPGYVEATTTTTTAPPIPPLLPAKGELVGRLLIPSIGLDQMILAGTDTGTLKKAPGLWENSIFPGTPGNAMIAGHRTTYGGPFRHLNDLAPGDKIIFEAPGQPPAVFEVRGSDVVSPKQVTVGAQTSGVRLTLTTCDPPGSAAKRLVVQAELVEGAYVKDALPASLWTFQS